MQMPDMGAGPPFGAGPAPTSRPVPNPTGSLSVVVGPAQFGMVAPVEWDWRYGGGAISGGGWDSGVGSSTQVGVVPNDLGRALYNVRQRLKANRKQIKRACYACRLKKAKCDEARPCKRCLATGKADTCCDDFREDTESGDGGTPGDDQSIDTKTLAELAVVQRPMKEKVGMLMDDNMVPGHRQAAAQLPGALRFWWNAGHTFGQLQSIFDSLPPRLAAVATKIVRAVDIVMQFKEQQARAALPPGYVPLERTGLELPMHEVHQCRPGECQLAVWMDPANMSRQGMAISFNSASLTGVHPEEYTARAGNHELGLPFSDVDAFCMLMDDLVNMERDHSTRFFLYHRFLYSTELNPTRSLIRWDIDRIIDPCGEYMQMNCKFNVCTAEEYEDARRADPNSCRPLRYIMEGGVVDQRGTTELVMDDASADTFDVLKRTPEGMKQCDRLAAYLEEKAEPMVNMAEMVAGMELLSLKGKWKCAAVEELP